MRKLAFVATAVVALAATAATPVHRVPGEWEATNSMHFSKGGMQIPSAVRKQMEARGMKIPDYSAPRTVKFCLTPEDAARDEHQFSQNKYCKTSNMRWSGGKFHAEITCDMAGGQSRGQVDGSMAANGKSYSGTMRMEGEQPAMGGSYVMEGTIEGHWLGPTCSKGAG